MRGEKRRFRSSITALLNEAELHRNSGKTDSPTDAVEDIACISEKRCTQKDYEFENRASPCKSMGGLPQCESFASEPEVERDLGSGAIYSSRVVRAGIPNAVCARSQNSESCGARVAVVLSRRRTI